MTYNCPKLEVFVSRHFWVHFPGNGGPDETSCPEGWEYVWQRGVGSQKCLVMGGFWSCFWTWGFTGTPRTWRKNATRNAWKQILLKFWTIVGHLVPPYPNHPRSHQKFPWACISDIFSYRASQNNFSSLSHPPSQNRGTPPYFKWPFGHGFSLKKWKILISVVKTN